MARFTTEHEVPENVKKVPENVKKEQKVLENVKKVENVKNIPENIKKVSENVKNIPKNEKKKKIRTIYQPTKFFIKRNKMLTEEISWENLLKLSPDVFTDKYHLPLSKEFFDFICKPYKEQRKELEKTIKEKKTKTNIYFCHMKILICALNTYSRHYFKFLDAFSKQEQPMYKDYSSFFEFINAMLLSLPKNKGNYNYHCILYFFFETLTNLELLLDPHRKSYTNFITIKQGETMIYDLRRKFYNMLIFNRITPANLANFFDLLTGSTTEDILSEILEQRSILTREMDARIQTFFLNLQMRSNRYFYNYREFYNNRIYNIKDKNTENTENTEDSKDKKNTENTENTGNTENTENTGNTENKKYKKKN